MTVTNPENDPHNYRKKGYWRCGRNDGCGQTAGWGTDHVGVGACKLHGGATPSGPEHGAYAHGLYSDVLREEDKALLEQIEQMRTAVKLEDVFNLQVVRLYRAIESLESDPDRQTVWDTIHELVEKVENPSTGDLQALARMFGENDRAIREHMDLMRRTAKDLHKITDGETVRHEHTVEDGEADLAELQKLAEDLF